MAGIDVTGLTEQVLLDVAAQRDVERSGDEIAVLPAELSGPQLRAIASLRRRGITDDKLEKLLKNINAPWIPPGELNFKTRHDTCNAHIHPATVDENGEFYELSLDTTYIPCAASNADIIKILQAQGCTSAVLKAQTCFGTNQQSLLDSLKALKFAGIDATGIATVAEDISEAAFAELEAAGVKGVRHAFLPHLLSSPSKFEEKKAEALTVASKIEPHKFVTNMYFEASNIAGMRETVLEIAEKTPVTLDHMCRPQNRAEFEALAQLLRDGKGRIHVLLSGPDRTLKSSDPAEWKEWEDANRYKKMLVQEFPDLCTVGTDFNHPNSLWGVPDDAALWNWLREGLSDQEWYKVSYANPMRLYWGRDVPAFDPKLHASGERVTYGGAVADGSEPGNPKQGPGA